MNQNIFLNNTFELLIFCLKTWRGGGGGETAEKTADGHRGGEVKIYKKNGSHSMDTFPNVTFSIDAIVMIITISPPFSVKL